MSKLITQQQFEKEERQNREEAISYSVAERKRLAASPVANRVAEARKLYKNLTSDEDINEPLDRRLIPIIKELHFNGFPTIGESCQGGRNHWLSRGMLLVDANYVVTPTDVQSVHKIIQKLVSTPFTIRRGPKPSVSLHGKHGPKLGDFGEWSSRVYTAYGDSYIIRFAGPIRLRK